MPTIVLVDDDANILASVKMALEAEGFATRSFTDGNMALQLWPTSRLTLVFSILKCPAWMVSNYCVNCVKPAKCQWFF